MRCLTSSEIHKWLTGQGMHHQPFESGVPVAGDFQLPDERRARLQFADRLADLLSKDGNKLVEILPAPQSRDEEWNLIDHFRASLEETGPLLARPGHLFKSRDRSDFRQMLAMLMGFENPCLFYVYSAPSRTSFLISGRRIEMWSHKKGVRNELCRHLAPAQAA